MDDDCIITSGAIKTSWPASVIEKYLEVSNFIYNFLSFGKTARIPCRTMIKLDIYEDISHNSRCDGNDEISSCIFRSNPYMNAEEWYDWAWFRWEIDENTEHDIPGKIFAFVDLRYVEISQESLLEKGLNRSIYACIRSLKNIPSKMFPDSRILHKSVFEDNMDKYRLVEIESITNNCYVVPNFNSLIEGDYNEWIVLENRYGWGNHFST